jgi:hypothetical protein
MLRKLGRLGEICLFVLKHPTNMEYVLCADSGTNSRSSSSYHGDAFIDCLCVEEELVDWMESLLLEIFRESFTVAATPTAATKKLTSSQQEERERTMQRDLSMK